jgi:hypothetical protein
LLFYFLSEMRLCTHFVDAYNKFFVQVTLCFFFTDFHFHFSFWLRAPCGGNLVNDDAQKCAVIFLCCAQSRAGLVALVMSCDGIFVCESAPLGLEFRSLAKLKNTCSLTAARSSLAGEYANSATAGCVNKLVGLFCLGCC